MALSDKGHVQRFNEANCLQSSPALARFRPLATNPAGQLPQQGAALTSMLPAAF